MTGIIHALRRQHSNISGMLDAFERQLCSFDAGESPDYDIIQGSVAYCLHYLDRCHHPREQLLARKLCNRNPGHATIVEDLEKEHGELLQRARRVQAAIQNVLWDVEVPRQAIGQLARDFVDSYRHHMTAEERVFFPAAIASLEPDDWAELDERFSNPTDSMPVGATEDSFAASHASILAWDHADRALRDSVICSHPVRQSETFR
jgi:hemerythrin-like domain-containing protein